MPAGRPDLYIEEMLRRMQELGEFEFPQSTGRAKGNLGGPAVPQDPGYMQEGKVRSYNPSRGYGFIEPHAGGKDIFMHGAESGMSDNFKPESGQQLYFRSGPDPRGRGPMAYDVNDQVDDEIGPSGNVQDYPKYDPQGPDYSDYEGAETPQGSERMQIAMDKLGDKLAHDEGGRFGGDSELNWLRGFVESPEGVEMYEYWQRTGDPQPFIDAFKEFETYSYNPTSLDDLQE